MGIVKVNEELCTGCGLCEKDCLPLGYPDVQYQRSAPRKTAQIRWIEG